MDNDKVNEVLQKHIDRFRGQHLTPWRFPKEGSQPSGVDARRHCLALAEEAITWPPERFLKKMRWMSFINGVVWALDGVRIQELKEASMPDEEKA